MYFLSLVLILLSLNTQAAFNDMDCLNVNFNTTIVHKGPPLGLTENVLKIHKSLCVITIEHEKLKFFNKKWEIDVCREPVHIKSGSKDVEVIKRPLNCSGESKGHEFCTTMQDIFTLVQDDGLIFANGEKEDLSSDHGKVYCNFLLVKKYLEEGFVLSRFSVYENFIVKGLSSDYAQSQNPQYSNSNSEQTPSPSPSPSPTSSEQIPEKYQQ